tara:strand:+ start:291 stop:413 length:123 start_codon:yes stop_codon:yes gene_type:complete
MTVEIKKLNDTEYIIYLVSETGQKLKARIIKTDLEDEIWR